ncbi:hypothetical protein AGABI2DRAFT_192196 [Agaricus bisporus var. bisporus H97]|uniref:hypothetical protein n=1 Tax=Agaricus bisporus var. bisporus (strain H97 / ATCC MYA-4626 / FGSC 10389) TaxID=936046 RepID=UPI00029F6EFF|nr:hypothetical protein AGABI2DRAFT_192196 [Agaricus bisporus var. bisporus H97]EKV48660.1 hypothetical protein AGABI2DRAFT_192196 [Agaricus bisporus var. bisporus H97]
MKWSRWRDSSEGSWRCWRDNSVVIAFIVPVCSRLRWLRMIGLVKGGPSNSFPVSAEHSTRFGHW